MLLPAATSPRFKFFYFPRLQQTALKRAGSNVRCSFSSSSKLFPLNKYPRSRRTQPCVAVEPKRCSALRRCLRRCVVFSPHLPHPVQFSRGLSLKDIFLVGRGFSISPSRRGSGGCSASWFRWFRYGVFNFYFRFLFSFSD